MIKGVGVDEFVTSNNLDYVDFIKIGSKSEDRSKKEATGTPKGKLGEN